jgi:hypothetical protein
LNKPKAQGEARGRGVNVRSSTAEDEAYVGGVRGSTQDIPENVNVTSGRASGKAQVVGIDVGTAGSTRTQDLVENFKQLNEANQRKLMRSLLIMLDNQEKSNA